MYEHHGKGFTMTVIEQSERELGKMGSKLEWSGALVRALGNPSEWDYLGTEPADAGVGSTEKCSCGHGIRYVFTVNHPDGRTANIGSECINYFSAAGAIFDSLTAADTKLRNRIAEAKKASKAAADEIKVAQAKVSFETVYATVRALFLTYRERGQMAPRALWWDMASSGRISGTAPTYQRPCDYLKWYSKQTALLQEHLKAS